MKLLGQRGEECKKADVSGGVRVLLGLLRNVRDVVRNLKHRGGRPLPKFCPRCCSPRLRLSTGFDGWFFPVQYVCDNCGYRGPVVMELEREEQNECAGQ